MADTTLAAPPSTSRLLLAAALGARGRKGSTLPDTTLRLASVAVDRDHLLRYQRMCGFGVNDALPHTYPHVLAFPLQTALMSASDFPMPLPGMVHLANEITVHRALGAEDVLDVAVTARDLRPHPKGRLVDVVTVVDVAGEPVWEGRSTYLSRGHGDAEAPREAKAPALPDGPPVAVLRLGGDLGRRYAAASGDVNPIHLHPLTAKAMGFPRAIAHGMWTYARTLALLGPVTYAPSTSHVWFKKPVLLPATVELVVSRSAETTVAGMRSRRDPAKEHLALTFVSARD